MKTIPKRYFAVLLILLSSVFLHPHHQDEDFQIQIPKFSESPKIDGKLENSIWEKGKIIQNFTQYEPLENSHPSEKTIAYMGYDSKFLYIAFRCFDSDPKAIRACLTQRDKVQGDDEVIVYLDTFNDKKRAFVFQANPCGVQSDGVYSETGRRMGFRNIDKNWDTYFLSQAEVTDEGFTVEMAIPFKSLRFPNKETQVWGLQVQRNIRRKNEEIYWHPRSRDVNGFLIQAGKIEIQGPLEKGKNFEVMPVMTASKQDKDKFLPDLGANLKYGITSDLTADLAINPDFSQIEADIPQVDVNQRYALYYPEKRPFFLEGKDIFDTPFDLVYTRTIVDPDWGIKLTGKIGKTSLGFLSAYDAHTSEIYFSLSENNEEEEEEAPTLKGFVNIFRLKQDLFSESYVGLILTDKEVGDSWDSITRDHNRIAGVDGHFKFKNYYTLSFQVLGSQSRVDGTKTKMIPATNFSFSRNSRHWQISASYYTLPENFEASTGFFRRKDIKSFRSRISYAILPQNKWIVDIRPSIEYSRASDFDSILTDEQLELNFFLSGWKGTHIWGGYTTELERYEGIDFYKQSFRVSMGSEPLSWLSGNLSFSFGDGIYYDDLNPYLGYKTSKNLRLTLRPLSNLNIFYNLKNDKFFEAKGDKKVYSINIISQRIQLQISRTLSIRLITDYNDYYKELYNSFLFSYEYRPGTVFYVGMEDNREKDDIGIFQREGRYYFIKFSYWWRI